MRKKNDDDNNKQTDKAALNSRSTKSRIWKSDEKQFKNRENCK